MSLTDLLLMNVALFVTMLAGAHYHRRQRERMKRGWEILNRFSPERSKKPLGL